LEFGVIDDTVQQIKREMTRVENELVAQRRAYDDLLRVATDKLRLLDLAEHDRDQYLKALRRIEAICERNGRHGGMTVLIDEVRACYADVPGVAE
jgi:hypothetical protein